MIAEGFSGQSATAGFAGGLLIGLAAAIMLLGLGRIAGVSGLAARATGITDAGPPKRLAWAFLAGLPLGAAALGLLGFGRPSAIPSAPFLLVAGLLVGFGTRLGSGCISGHGACGVSRLSPRSLAATIAFVAAGVATVALMRGAGVVP